MNHRILVVEDNPQNLELVRDWLESEGHEVEGAVNLQQGLSAIQANPPDLILLDVQLGHQDGLELAAWIRKTPPFQKLPIIAVTAHAMVVEQESMMRAGCNSCVSKPVDFDVLRERISTWLKGFAARRGELETSLAGMKSPRKNRRSRNDSRTRNR